MFGLIARADNRGLGQQTWAVYRNLKPAKTLIVDCPSAQPLQMRFDRFPDADIVHGLPTHEDMHRFLDGLDAVYTAETGYGSALWDVSTKMGVTTVLHANYEFWDQSDRPTTLAVPSPWNIDRFPPDTLLLRVPIETDRLEIEPHPKTAQHFLHIVGRPAIHDRNGTLDLLKALQYVTAPITLTITCQQHGYVGGLINDHHIQIPDHVKLNVELGDNENYWDNYHRIDALILPRRFGGLCLPANEAVGAGIPVIMPDIDPNNSWLPKAWLVPAALQGDFWAKQHVFYYQADVPALAAKIDTLAQDEDFYQHSLYTARNLRQALSWEALEPAYRAVL